MAALDDGGTPPRAWKLLLPWGVLPLALAIIVLADWLTHACRRARRREAA
jgi:hypothetical protein